MTRYFETRPSLNKYFAKSGTFTDPRDGNIYKTVEINGQIWLAENLRYEGVKHYAPNGDDRNIKKYGCLYKLEDAMVACPKGWHLPTYEEFNGLLKAAGSSEEERFNNLRAQDWGGRDSLGFKALPAGCYGDYGGRYTNFGVAAEFWSATEASTDRSYRLGLGRGDASIHGINKKLAFSVRCIKDDSNSEKKRAKDNAKFVVPSSFQECAKQLVKLKLPRDLEKVVVLLKEGFADKEISGNTIDYEWGEKPYVCKITKDGYYYWDSVMNAGPFKASWKDILNTNSEESEEFVEEFNPLWIIEEGLRKGIDFSPNKINLDIVM